MKDLRRAGGLLVRRSWNLLGNGFEGVAGLDHGRAHVIGNATSSAQGLKKHGAGGRT